MVIKNRYSKEFRKAVLTAYFTGRDTMEEVSRRFGINKGTIGTWVVRYKSEYVHLEQDPSNHAIFTDKPVNESLVSKEQLTASELESRLKVLEQQLEQERMRSTCLDKLIDIAERDLNIVIRKKSGAKQLKK